ncbi:MAG: quinone-dependent dihydroorotate dehydrogenase [Candidatus Magasanikbacteria bacterium]|jgi:dihydroorotate dehydrogenase
MIYEKIIRPILFKTDPEWIHNFVISGLSIVSSLPLVSNVIAKYFNVNDSSLITSVGKVKLNNPVGLAAGFDKNVTAPLAYNMLGFGYAELGSVTYSGQPGNPKPRLWRLPKDQSLIVYYGLYNIGAKNILEKMKKLKARKIPLGISIAPTTGLILSEMTADYLRSFEILYPYADFITLNVSCPNVAGCDLFAQISFIRELVSAINDFKKSKNIDLDIFVKIGPDMDNEQYDEILDICVANNVTAIIATNLIKKRESIKSLSEPKILSHPGGISGRLLRERSNEVIKHLYARANGRLKIIGLGGVFSAQDAYDKIKCGASAIQLITGFIYNGPWAMKNINKGLVELLKKDGYKNISEAVGRSVVK